MTRKVAKKKDETALVAASLENDAGAGFENQTGDDIIMPVIWLLQALSPSVVNDDPEGARPGKLMNSVTQELMTEFLFVPATTQHEFCEFVPHAEGGGFVKAYAPNDPVVKNCKATQPFGKYTVDRPDGGVNELVEFFSVFGVIVNDEDMESFAVMRYKSTKISVYKQFNTRMNMCQIPRVDGNGRFTPAINSHVIRVTTVKDSKRGFDFFNYKLTSAVENNTIKSLMTSEDPRYIAAAEVRRLVEDGRVVAEYAEEEVGGEDMDAPF